MHAPPPPCMRKQGQLSNYFGANLEAKTISKQEVNDEICHILACVLLQSSFMLCIFHFFSDYQCRPPFKYSNGQA